jgi:hypothetical protein
MFLYSINFEYNCPVVTSTTYKPSFTTASTSTLTAIKIDEFDS